MKPTYTELLKHPKWQRTRLEILQRAGFACEDCGSKEKTLHVRHTYYENGKAPWEYPPESLHALCETCHADAQRKMDWIAKSYALLEGDRKEEAIGFMMGLLMKQGDLERAEVFSVDVARGLALAFDISVERIMAGLEDGGIDLAGIALIDTKHGRD